MLCEKLMKNPKIKTLKGRFTHFENNCYLYFNNKDDNDLERHLIYSCLADLNNSYSKENNFYRNYLYLQEIDYKIGFIYAAIYSQDKMFYRVKLLKFLDFEKVHVSFVDYGNSEIISKAELAPLPHEISKIKPLALLCKIPNIEIISEKAFMKLISCICLTDMSIKIENQTYLTTINENGTQEKDILHLITFIYNGMNIRDYLIKNKIAVNLDEVYEPINLWPDYRNIDNEPLIISNSEDHVLKNDLSPLMEFTKTVIITSVTPNCDIFVHDFCKNVKIKLESLQLHIGRVVDNYKGGLVDNIFNKRNVYLAQFSEDLMWYRCRITHFDPSQGFLVQYIDFGNFENKNNLSELKLLTREMGTDAIFLMDEEPVAQLCQLSSDVIQLFPKSVNIKKYLNKNFVEPVKKISITYSIVEDHETVWVIKNILYHHQNICEMLDKQCVLKESLPINKDCPSELSSRSLHDDGDIKVADYLLNGCPELEEEFFLTMDSNRQYMVTHIGDLDEIWIDIGDGQTQEMCDNLLSTIPQQPSVSEVVIDYIYGVNYLCKDGRMLPIRCKIIDICDNYIKVHLIDKGPTKNVRLDDIFKLSAEIVALPQQVLKFRLPENLVLKMSKETLLSDLRNLLEGQFVRLLRQSLQTNVILDIIFNNKSVLQVIISKQIASIPDDDNWFSLSLDHQNVSVQTNMHNMKHRKNYQSIYSI